MLGLRNERRVVRVVGREELRPLREELDAVDMPERPAQRERREQDEDGDADETGSHGAKVYASGPFPAYFTPAIPR
jgi:hypothetical protein